MCICNVNRKDVQALPDAEREALLRFALDRREKANGDHATDFWNSLVETCISDGEFEGLHYARQEEFDRAGQEVARKVRYVP